MKTTRTTNYRYGRLPLHIIPILVWLATVACVVMLFRHRSQRFEVIGIAQAQVHDVGTNIRARLISVPVQLFDKVSRGDTVAVLNTVLDDEHLEAELATISAEIQHLVAESGAMRNAYIAEVDNRRSEWVAERRAFTSDVVTARLRILELTTLLEKDRMMLEDRELDIKGFIIQDRLQTDDTALYELQKFKVRRDALAKKVEENERLLIQSRQELKEAIGRQDEFVKNNKPYLASSDETAQDLMLKATKVLERQMNELQERRVELVLKAPCDGFVSSIDNQIGEIGILPDFPVLSITEENPSSIIAHASKDLVGRIAIGKPVELIKDSEPPQIARSQVTYIGPRVEQIPIRLWRNPNIAQWGQPILMKIPPGLKLLPGETVGIRGL